IDCGQPVNIPGNSTIISSTGVDGNTSYNATRRVVCNQGFNYTLPGNDIIRCTDRGQWNGTLGQCQVIDCGQPVNIPGNSTIISSTGVAGNTSYNATRRVVCNQGFNYTLPGNDIIRCTDRGQWNGTLGQCQVIDCGQPVNIPGNSTIISSTGVAGNTSYNATRRVVCNQGFNYTLPGNDIIRCTDRGQWNGTLGHCQVIDCGQPVNIPGNSTIISSTGLAGNTSYNATRRIVCNQGFNYTLPGNDNIRCTDRGQWNGTLGQCQVIDCGQPVNIPDNSTIISSTGLAGNTSYNATKRVVCNQGFNYTLPVNDLIRCTDSGQWNGTLGHCQVIDCGQPVNIPDNSTIVYSTGLAGSTSYNATMRVVCNHGFNYSLPGNESIRCTHEGQWIGILGHCQGDCILFSHYFSLKLYLEIYMDMEKEKAL
ncbi:hypothetical protein CHS0354_010658, partial [Potamilus streckersoni]